MTNLIEKLKIENFFVNDLNLKTASIIFILESGDVEELKNRNLPAQGLTGINMTRRILPDLEKKPFGEIIQEKEYKNTFGIMEASVIPLGPTARLYQCKKSLSYIKKVFSLNKYDKRKCQLIVQINKYYNMLRDLETIDFIKKEEINTPKKLKVFCNKIEKSDSKLKHQIIDKFAERFDNLKNKLFIVCGFISQALFCIINKKYFSDNKIEYNLLWDNTFKKSLDLTNNNKFRFMNHPVNWDIMRKKYSDRLDSIKENIEDIISANEKRNS